ncbi:hypothetical protein BHM03_00019296 [Ensete ventricosum]|nr:hypothetical protein BHM03_00019296 [Ensete ventricosum]
MTLFSSFLVLVDWLWNHRQIAFYTGPTGTRIYAVNTGEQAVDAAPTLALSRACSIIMLLAYVAYLFFQLKTHRRLFDSYEQEGDEDDDDVVSEDEPVIGFASALIWLVGMTVVIALLSEYVVGTIEVCMHFDSSTITQEAIMLD